MSFGQAVFFGSAGYGVALIARDLGVTSILAGAAGRPADRAHIRAAARRLPSARPASLQRDLRFAGHAHRLLRRRSAGAGLVLSRRPERHPLDPADDARQLRYHGGAGLSIISCSVFSCWSISLCRFLVRSQFGLALAGLRENEQRIAFFGYQVQRLKAIIFSFARRHRGACRQPLCLSRRFRLAQHAGRRDVDAGRALCVVRRLRHADRRRHRHGRRSRRSASGCRTAIRTSGRSSLACCCCWSSCSVPPA